MNTVLRHTPGSSAVIRFTNGERIGVSISGSGIRIEKHWLRVFHRRLFHWPRNDPKRLDRAIVFFMSGPNSDLPGATVLELIVSRFLRECHSVDDVKRLCERIAAPQAHTDLFTM
jgi:hypothetical protein